MIPLEEDLEYDGSGEVSVCHTSFRYGKCSASATHITTSQIRPCGLRTTSPLLLAGRLARSTESLLATLRASRFTLRASDDIDDDLPAVLAAGGACAMRELEGSALALPRPSSRNGVMAAALRRLGPIPTHSYYHSRGTIPCFPRKAKGPPDSGSFGLRIASRYRFLPSASRCTGVMTLNMASICCHERVDTCPP